MAMAYDALDDAIRARVEGLEVAHKYGRGRRRPDEQPANPIINDDQDARVPPIYHPLVLSHPVTGRKALYALGHGAHGIRGMDQEEGLALIESLKAHVLQDRFLYSHRYQVGDVAIWDTLATMHRATPIDIPTREEEARLLWRISVRGKPVVLH
jgi:taurine dioxygenase